MARRFNGSSDKIDVKEGGVIATSTGSFSFWYYIDSLPASYAGLYNAASNDPQFLLKVTGGLAMYGIFNSVQDPVPNSIVSTKTWNHALIAGGVGVPISVYVNGLLASAAVTGTGNSDQSRTATIGVDASLRWFNGRMADVAVWNVILTASEAIALSQGIRPNKIRSASLLNWWPLSGLTPNEPNLTPFAKNGTLTGTTFAPDPPFLQTEISQMLKDMTMFPPTVTPILFGHNIGGHFSRRITTIGY